MEHGHDQDRGNTGENQAEDDIHHDSTVAFASSDGLEGGADGGGGLLGGLAVGDVGFKRRGEGEEVGLIELLRGFVHNGDGGGEGDAAAVEVDADGALE